MRVPELHSIFHEIFLARSSPSTHRNWANDIPFESCCKHATFPCWSFFHTHDDFKKKSEIFYIVVELPAVFTLNFCDVFSFVILSSIRQCYTNDIPFVQTSLTINFSTFSDRGLELTQMIFLPFWSKLENGEIMSFFMNFELICYFNLNFCWGNLLNMRNFLYFPGMCTWTSGNKIFRLRLFIHVFS